MKIFVSIVLLIIAWLVSGSQLAAQMHLDFDALSIDDGFTSSRANVIIQDRAGFIWVGTWNGLNRYDGYECVVYQPGYRDSLSLSNREVTALIEDSEGYIWIGTTFGLSRLNPRTDEITRYPFENRILSLCEDRNNHIWVGTAGDGLYKIDLSSGERTKYLGYETINHIYEDSKNNFWLATWSGLINFDRETQSYKRYLQFDRPEGGKRWIGTLDITESKNGTLWVGTNSDGLIKLIPNANKDSIRFEQYAPRESSGGLGRFSLSNLCFDDNDNLWLGSWGDGLYMLSASEQNKLPQQAWFMCYRNNVNDPFGIEGDNHISSVFVDRLGTLWVGSSVMNVANIGNKGINRYNTRQIINDRVVNNWVRTLYMPDPNHIWLGTSNGLIRYSIPSNERANIGILNSENGEAICKPMGEYPILSILSHQSGNMWIGTDGDGIYLVPKEQFRKDKFAAISKLNTGNSPGLAGNRVKFMVPSKKYPNVTWIASTQGGFSRCDWKNGNYTFQRYTAGGNSKSITDNNIRAIIEDTDGFVWIGTQHGLNRFNPNTETFDHFFYSASDTLTINDNVINVLFEETNKSLWVGTNAGLNKMQWIKNSNGQKTIVFRAFPRQKRIQSEIILNILEDGHKNLWIGIYNGILKFNTQTEHVDFEFFDKAYQRIKIDQNAACKDANGVFYFGGGNGFLRFHPDSLQNKRYGPMVQLTSLQVFNKKVGVGELLQGHKILTKQISYTDSLTLSYKHSVFTLVFSSMDFHSPSKTNFAYMLEGYDKDWNLVGNRNAATYTNLPPGSYEFRVKAQNSMGEWSAEPRTIFIKIKPPFWRTYFAYIVYMLLVMGLLFALQQYLILRMKEKGRLMVERIHYEKEHELNDLKIQFFTNITHEFRTPLTLILGPLQEMLDNKSKFGNYSRNLELIHRNANRLLRLINQLMEFRKVEKGKMELLLQETDIIPVLNEVCDSFQSLADSKKIDFVLHYSEPSLFAWIDRDKFDKVLFNLLSNAFKFTDEEGKITVKAGYVEGSNKKMLFLDIEDNGIGIPSEKKEMVFERFYQLNQKNTQSTGGIGLYLSKAFIELHNGTIELESESGKGSCFRIIVPVNMNSVNHVKKENMPEAENAVETFSASESIPEMEDVPKGIDDNDEQQFIQSSRPLVLLVEDDLDMNEFIRQSLSSQYKVKSTFNGKEALEMARKLDPEIIISDIMMPEMDGLELGRLLQSDINTSHIPILYLTAKTTRENEMEGLQIGAVDYIYKPFSMSALRLKITNILNQRNSLRESVRKADLLEPEQITLTSLDDQFLKDAVESVNNHLDDTEFDVEKLSNAIGLSSNQTYRKLKALTGQTAKEFIRNQRLKTAAMLLLQKRRSVSEIIYMVGFSSPSYFTRCFREYYGCTPSEYIENEGKSV